MIVTLLRRAGLRSDHLHGSALASIALGLSMWIRAKTIDQDERGNAERRAIFVGHWAPMLWLIGDAVGREERAMSGRDLAVTAARDALRRCRMAAAPGRGGRRSR